MMQNRYFNVLCLTKTWKREAYPQTTYVLYVSHLSFVNLVSSNLKKINTFLFRSYINKFDKNSFRTGEKRMPVSQTINKKTELHFICMISQS